MVERVEHPNPQSAVDSAGADSPSPVFISYASVDKTIAEQVCKVLEGGGVRCWIAPRDVVPGEFYADAIVRGIDAAKVLVLVLSQHAIHSPHVLREVERASSKKHLLISLRTDLAPLPGGLEYFLNTSQWLDASTVGVDQVLPRLADAVQRYLAQAAEPGRSAMDYSVAPVMRPSPRFAVARIAIVVGALIAAGLIFVAVDRIILAKRAVVAQSPTTVRSPESTTGKDPSVPN